LLLLLLLLHCWTCEKCGLLEDQALQGPTAV